MKLDIKKNTMRGAISGVFNKVIVTIFPFIMRTIMIYYMGTQYLGLSSLFASILNMLSLAELGFGTALVYSMYKPIAENNTKAICALLGLYKKIYRIIGTVIFLFGLGITPFLRYMISGDIPADINIYVLFWIYLINTVASYFLFAYKNSLLAAFQRNDISNNVSTVLTSMEYIIQIVLVIIFKNYYCYAIVFPVFTILGNIVRAIIVDRKYPQYFCDGNVDKIEKKDIYKRTFALASHKIGNTISTSFDSLVVSAFLGLSSVGVFGNYNYIVTTIMALIWIVYFSMTAGIGNRMNLNSRKENYKEFLAMSRFNNVISCWATGCMLFLYQPFMKLWAGENNLLGVKTAIIFSIYFYIYQSRKVVLVYKDAAGIWREDQWKPIVGALFNLILNISLVQIIGINGVILSSILSFVVVEIPWETYVLVKGYFHENVGIYVKKQIKDMILCLPVWLFLGILCSLVNISALPEIIIKLLICTVVPIPYLWVMYKKDREFMKILKNFLPGKIVNKL